MYVCTVSMCVSVVAPGNGANKTVTELCFVGKSISIALSPPY